MKKFTIISLTVVLVGAISIAALAHRAGTNPGPQNQMHGPRGGMLHNNQQMPMYGGRGNMHNAPQNQQMPGYGGRGGKYNQNQQMPMYGGRGGMHGRNRQFDAPYGGGCPYYDGTAPNAQTAPRVSEMISEAKVQEVAEEFVAKYFPDYTVQRVEKDEWRPLYFVTITGANDAEHVMTVHAFTGKVMNIFPKTSEETETK